MPRRLAGTAFLSFPVPAPRDSAQTTAVLSEKTVVGGSREPCYDKLGENAASPCNQKACEIVGGVCLSKTSFTDTHNCVSVGTALESDATCGVLKNQRCQGDGDCKSTEKCRSVRIDCNPSHDLSSTQDALCAPASWKARGNGDPVQGTLNDARARLADVYELTGNPEEVERVRSGARQLDAKPNLSNGRLDGVVADLDVQLACWRQCVTADDDTLDCDRESTSWGTPCQ